MRSVGVGVMQPTVRILALSLVLVCSFRREEGVALSALGAGRSQLISIRYALQL